MDHQPEDVLLSDGDIRLRPARLPEDVPLAADWYCDPEVMHLSEGDASARYDLATIEQMYRCLAGQGELYIIELQRGESWVAIGDATLAQDTLPIVIGVAEYRSRGYGQRILKLLIDRARSLGWRQLKVKGIYTFNPRARRFYEHFGFEQDGDVFHESEGPASMKYVMQL